MSDLNSTYYNGKYISPDPKLDWAANLSHMMGECAEVLREKEHFELILSSFI